MSKSDCEEGWGPQSVALVVSAALNAGFAIGLAWKCSRKRKENKHEVKASNKLTQNVDGTRVEEREVTATIWTYEDNTNSAGKIKAGKIAGIKRPNKRDQEELQEGKNNNEDPTKQQQVQVAVAAAITSARKAANADTDQQREAAYIHLVEVVRSRQQIAVAKSPVSNAGLPLINTNTEEKPIAAVAEAKPENEMRDVGAEQGAKPQVDVFAALRSANNRNLATASGLEDGVASASSVTQTSDSASKPKAPVDIFAAAREAKSKTTSEPAREVPAAVEDRSARDVHVDMSSFQGHVDQEIQEAISRRNSLDLMVALSTPHHIAHEEDPSTLTGDIHAHDAV